MSNLTEALGLKVDESPFPWQDELLARLLAGIGNRMSLDIPTGLGKTSVMAAWLLDRSQGASLPRRLVYVVDRRAVVDRRSRNKKYVRLSSLTVSLERLTYDLRDPTTPHSVADLDRLISIRRSRLQVRTPYISKGTRDDI